mmetsp:Transcript_53981/g.155836  ORF Transcript_53981/g.155836 Transcript_53981/m.155836 type:complete len:292 (-) Transcript_53981:1087-1962(-)
MGVDRSSAGQEHRVLPLLRGRAHRQQGAADAPRADGGDRGRRAPSGGPRRLPQGLQRRGPRGEVPRRPGDRHVLAVRLGLRGLCRRRRRGADAGASSARAGAGDHLTAAACRAAMRVRGEHAVEREPLRLHRRGLLRAGLRRRGALHLWRWRRRLQRQLERSWPVRVGAVRLLPRGGLEDQRFRGAGRRKDALQGLRLPPALRRAALLGVPRRRIADELVVLLPDEGRRGDGRLREVALLDGRGRRDRLAAAVAREGGWQVPVGGLHERRLPEPVGALGGAHGPHLVPPPC